jgi:hypothetical protein
VSIELDSPEELPSFNQIEESINNEESITSGGENPILP